MSLIGRFNRNRIDESGAFISWIVDGSLNLPDFELSFRRSLQQLQAFGVCLLVS